MKTTPAAYLRQISRLRAQHTANDKLERFDLNATVDKKLIDRWAAFHDLCARFRAERACLVCGHPAHKELIACSQKHLDDYNALRSSV